MGNSPFKIKVKNEINGEGEITITKKDTIFDVKRKICKIQYKIDFSYINIYKDEQLLDENNRVSNYNITPSDILTYKSSRKDEFLVFFDGHEKLVTKEEDIYSAFNQIDEYFHITPYSKYGYSKKLIYENIILSSNSTFGEYNIKEGSSIFVELKALKG